MKRQGQASNSSGLGRIAPCRIQIRQGATIVQSQEDDRAECQSWSNRAFGFGQKEPMGSRSYQTQKATSEDVALIALAGSTGLEPATSDVTGRRSNQTELTPQAVVRVCFRSRALRGLVYTEVCPVRNNFFENIFWALREGLRGRLARVKFAALQSCARRKAH